MNAEENHTLLREGNLLLQVINHQEAAVGLHLAHHHLHPQEATAVAAAQEIGDDNMTSLKILLAAGSLLLLQGCYTVIWTPDMDFPTKDTSEANDSFYDGGYYGGYTPYYEVPWWYSYPAVSVKEDILTKVRNAQQQKLREGGNAGEDRPTTIERKRPDLPILIGVDPPSRSDDSGNKSTDTQKTDEVKTKSRDEAPPQRDRGNSDNSKSTRNNDGSRSSDPPRR